MKNNMPPNVSRETSRNACRELYLEIASFRQTEVMKNGLSNL